ncbi:Uma2 family endonuclease [Acaryochloris sp. CCMEE 5410]|uniref:Uma2 family endonuclease n=1 Tax=Acaryochloris sp. CCMEE 5410 TaxID=310037 RepID=UPI00024852EF|nr:Uma2 family endonuclease [Acaryochloris sp. CCMEE 5410]KAI9131126.1 Uma2 family endonuclease [Acaryochloris sp. CCMEE 5410]
MQTQQPVVKIPKTLPAEQRLTLNNIDWKTYENILAAFGEHRAVRLHYSAGVLELMVPLEAHENPSDVIGVFIRTLAFESGQNIKGMASTTLRRKELLKGAEPDRGYYIQNESVVRGRTVDLDVDPPPDLVVEVDISHTDINKNDLYAQMGVPELWRFDGQILRIYQLEQGQYQDAPVSPTFPWVPLERFYHFLQQCKTVGETPAYRELKTWVQDHAPKL